MPFGVSRFPVFVFASFALFSTGCGPNLAFLSERSQSEAQILQESCRKAGLKNSEVSAGDALMAAAAKAAKDGEPASARLASEEAAGQYRVALARSDKDKERLSTYHEILEEMKTMRKP